MHSVPNDVVDLLKGAGWEPDRQVDVEEMIDSLRSAGFEVSSAAASFLSRFAFLKIDHEPSILLEGEKSCCWTRFDPTVVATRRDARIASRCAAVSGKALCPIGTDGFHFTIYISDDGAILAGVDASVSNYADSIDGLFRAMRDGIRPVQIGEWDISE